MWVSFLQRLCAAGPSLLPVLLDAAIKGVAILALTALATLAMRRASAAARHLVWFLGTLSLLILPILSAALPGWYILPRWAMNTPVRVQPPPAVKPAPVPAPAPISVSPPEARFVPGDPPTHTNTVAPAPAPSLAVPPAISAPLPQVPPPAPVRVTWQAWVLLSWIAGSALLLGYVALGFVSLWWLRRRSSPITEGSWPALLKQLSVQLGIRRPVELLSSPRRTMPMTWGLWRTRLLLPADAATWTADERRTVLLHELAHAKRWDCLTQLGMHLACALYWFNPLVWLAWRLMQTERERACDDLVLSTGTKASAYAEQLLHIAAEMPAVRFSAAAIAMARPSRLEGRLLAILDVRRNRRRLTWSLSLLAVSLIAVLAVPLAMLRAQTEKAPSKESTTQASSGPVTIPSDRGAITIVLPDLQREAVIVPHLQALAALKWDPQQLDDYVRQELARQPQDKIDPAAIVFSKDYTGNDAMVALTELADVRVRPLTFVPAEELRELAGRLTGASGQVAENSLRDVAALGPRARNIVPMLLPALRKAEKYSDALKVCFALGYLGPEAAEAIPTLVDKLRTAEDLDKSDWAGTLVKIGPASLPRLQELLHDPQEWTRNTAGRALAKLGPAGRDALLKALADADWRARAAAATAVDDCEGEARYRQPLVTLLADPQAEVRKGAVSSLRKYPADVPAVAALVKLLDDPSQDVREAATWTARTWGPTAVEAGPRILAMLDEPALRNDAVEALGAIRYDPKVVLPRLKPYFSVKRGEETELLCRSALMAVASYGPAAAELAPQVVACLRGESYVAQEALKAIDAIGGKERQAALGAIVEVATADNYPASGTARGILFAMGPDAAPAVDGMATLVKSHQSFDARFAGIKVLGAVGAPAKNTLPAMMPFVTMFYGSISQAPPTLLRVMASLDVDEAIKLIDAEARRPRTGLFDTEQSQAKQALANIRAIKDDMTAAADAAGKPEPTLLVSKFQAGENVWPRVLEWQRILRPGDTVERVVALLGTPYSASAAALEYRATQPPAPGKPLPIVRIQLDKGRVKAVQTGELSEPATQPRAGPATTAPAATQVPKHEQAFRSPLLACRELYVVQVKGVTKAEMVERKEEDAQPNRERRQTVTFTVLDTLLGNRKASDTFDYPVIAYGSFGFDPPETPWDFVDLSPGRRLLFAPGGKLEWNKDLPGTHEIPLVLGEVPSDLRPHQEHFRPSDLNAVRQLIAWRQLPEARRRDALREAMKTGNISPTIDREVRELLEADGDRAAIAQAVGAFALGDLSNDRRRDWVWFLTDLPDRSKPATDNHGNRQTYEALWKVLDRGEPPAGEDIRVSCSAATTLVESLYPHGGVYDNGKFAPGADWQNYYTAPAHFIPATCAKVRLLAALEYLRTHPSATFHYGDYVVTHDLRVDVLIEYVGAWGNPATAPAPAEYERLCAIWRKTEPGAGQRKVAVTDDERAFLLRELAGHRDIWFAHDFRRMAAITLGNLQAKEAVTALIARLDDPKEDAMTSAEAARALGKIADPAAIAPLLDALGDDRTWVRIYAAAALREMNPSAEAMKPLATPERFRALLDKLDTIPLPKSEREWLDSDSTVSNKPYHTARQIDALCAGLRFALPSPLADADRARAAAVAEKLLKAPFPAVAYHSDQLPNFASFCQVYQPALYGERTKAIPASRPASAPLEPAPATIHGNVTLDAHNGNVRVTTDDGRTIEMKIIQITPRATQPATAPAAAHSGTVTTDARTGNIRVIMDDGTTLEARIVKLAPATTAAFTRPSRSP